MELNNAVVIIVYSEINMFYRYYYCLKTNITTQEQYKQVKDLKLNTLIFEINGEYKLYAFANNPVKIDNIVYFMQGIYAENYIIADIPRFELDDVDGIIAGLLE